MKLIACSVLLLVLLGESYCKTTSTVTRTSHSWGYDYSSSDNRGYKVVTDENGYHLEPTYNISSSTFKPYYSSNTVYEHFESPGTNDNQSQSSTNRVNNDTPNGTTNSTSHGTADWSQGEGKRAETPMLTVPSGQPSASGTPATGTLHENSVKVPSYTPVYGPSGPMNGPPTGPMYGPPTGPMYGPPTGPMYGPPTGPYYGSPTGPIYGPPTGPYYGQLPGSINGPQTGPLYGPQTAPMYGPQTAPMHVTPPGPMYGPQNAPMYGPQTGPMYGQLNTPNYALPINPYGPQISQRYGRQNIYGYPTSSLDESYRNY